MKPLVLAPFLCGFFRFAFCAQGGRQDWFPFPRPRRSFSRRAGIYPRVETPGRARSPLPPSLGVIAMGWCPPSAVSGPGICRRQLGPHPRANVAQQTFCLVDCTGQSVFAMASGVYSKSLAAVLIRPTQSDLLSYICPSARRTSARALAGLRVRSGASQIGHLSSTSRTIGLARHHIDSKDTPGTSSFLPAERNGIPKCYCLGIEGPVSAGSRQDRLPLPRGVDRVPQGQPPSGDCLYQVGLRPRIYSFSLRICCLFSPPSPPNESPGLGE